MTKNALPHHNKIAIIFDFDDTLAPDSTSAYLKHQGIKDLDYFWHEKVGKLMSDDWNPVPAYLYQMIQAAKAGEIPPITQKNLNDFGRQLTLHQGVAEILPYLRQTARDISENIQVEFYIISSGIGDIVRHIPVAHEFSDIWASEFHFEKNNTTSGAEEEATFIKKIVSFTDKTRYVFQIHKGLVGAKALGKPFAVNQKLNDKQVHIPFEQMIFVGDGYTDIPCFSLIKKNNGLAIAVYDANRQDKWDAAYQFVRESRVNQLLTANYQMQSDLSNFLAMAVRKMAMDIHLRQSQGFF
jgi:phosphoserine phosphatase